MVVVLLLEGRFEHARQAFALRGAAVVEIDVRALALAAAVDVDEEGAAVFAFGLALQGVDFVAALLQAGHLVEGDGAAHASFALAVVQVILVADAVFRVLDDDVDLGAAHHQVAGDAEDDVVGVFILVQFPLSHTADGAGVGTAVAADEVVAGTLQLVGGALEAGVFLAEERFVEGRAFFRRFRGSLGRLLILPERRDGIFDSLEEGVVLAELAFVQADEFLAIFRRVAVETLEEEGHPFAVLGVSLLLSRRIESRQEEEEREAEEFREQAHRLRLEFFVDFFGEVDVVGGVVELRRVEVDAEGAGDGLLLEVGHVGPQFHQVLRRQDHHVDGIDPEPGVEVVIPILHEESLEEVVVERGIIISREEELVAPVVLVHVFGKHIDEGAVNVAHRRVGHYLLAGYVADAEGLVVDFATRVGLHAEVEALLRDAVDDDLAANLVDAIPPIFDTRSF